jgi:DNA sulfur modification protein DndE
MTEVKITAEGREQLIRLKRHTGIQNWNTLGRWALCASLREPASPGAHDVGGETHLSIEWEVFGGHYAELYWALVRERCRRDGLSTDDATVGQQLRLHLHRGISYLAGDKSLRSASDLITRAVEA